jgi:hypothetical protein
VTDLAAAADRSAAITSGHDEGSWIMDLGIALFVAIADSMIAASLISI